MEGEQPRPPVGGATERDDRSQRMWTDFAAAYEEGAHDLADSTLRVQRYHLNRIAALLPSDVDAISASDIERLHTTISRESSPETASRWLSTLSSFFRFVGECELQLDAIRRIRDRHRRRGFTKRRRAREVSAAEPVSAPELARTLEFVEEQSTEIQLILLLGLHGLRRGEIWAIRPQDVDLSRGLLRVEVNRPAGGSGELETPKSGRPRAVPLSCRIPALVERLARQSGESLIQFARAESFARYGWPALLDAAGVSRYRLKQLRSSFASHALTRGYPLAYVSRWLGHSSELTTRKHYAKWIDADPWSEFVLRDVPRQPPTDVLLDALEAEGGP